MDFGAHKLGKENNCAPEINAARRSDNWLISIQEISLQLDSDLSNLSLIRRCEKLETDSIFSLIGIN